MSDVPNPSIGPGRNSEPLGELRDGVDGSSLRSTDGHDFLSDTDRACSHPDLQSISSSSDEPSSLLSSYDVSSDDVDVRVGRLDPLNHLDLVVRASLRGIDDGDVESSFDKEGESLPVGRSSSDGGSAEELLGGRLLGRERVVLVFEEIGSSEEGSKVSVRVDDGEFPLSRVSEESVGFIELDSDLSDDEILGHDGGERSVGVSELNVSSGDDSEELASELASV